ncbi:DnaJ C-terminal domain-containing protein [Rhizobium sp. YIM 134829]|uniref:DnaJ C-terminal domain-containing protein n=1 Tax=Rhizobium sp. YIM 134829 TaxID=3390453 RepID=UPI00397CC2FC
MRDPYAVLGVRRNAGADEIKAAWRQVAKAVHPDHNRDDPQAAARFAEIGRAYEVLKNPALRSRYDHARREADLRRMEEEKRRNEPETVDAETAEEAMNRIFAADQARKSAAQAAAQPATTARTETPRTEKAAEAKPEIRTDAAPAELSDAPAPGAGPGAAPGATARASTQAAELLGALMRRFGMTGGLKATDKVPDILCETTVSIEDIYKRRRADTILPDGQTLKVAIPDGTTEGSEIRLKGEGFRLGSLRGDLVVKVRVAREARYRLDGFDLHAMLSLPLQDAVLGTETTIETPTGKVKVTIPAWSGAGREIRVEGHGLRDGAGGRGALIVELAIMLSDQPDPRLLDLMKSQRDGLIV